MAEVFIKNNKEMETAMNDLAFEIILSIGEGIIEEIQESIVENVYERYPEPDNPKIYKRHQPGGFIDSWIHDEFYSGEGDIQTLIKSDPDLMAFEQVPYIPSVTSEEEDIFLSVLNKMNADEDNEVNGGGDGSETEELYYWRHGLDNFDGTAEDMRPYMTENIIEGKNYSYGDPLKEYEYRKPRDFYSPVMVNLDERVDNIVDGELHSKNIDFIRQR